MKTNLVMTFRRWLPLAFGLSVVTLFVYVAVQQDLRLSANVPEIGMANDAVAAMNHGASANSIIPSNADTTDIADSQSPFVAVFDSQGKLMLSTAKLDGNDIHLPSGVFDYAKTHGVDRITWQPRPGIRIATVVESTSGSSPDFVVSGRSLADTENRESQLGLMASAAWIVAMAGSFVLQMLAEM